MGFLSGKPSWNHHVFSKFDTKLFEIHEETSGTHRTYIAERPFFKFRKQTIPGTRIILASTSPGQSFVKSASADQLGRFRIGGMAIADTLKLMRQIAGRNARKMSSKEAFIVQEWPGKTWEFGKMNTMLSWPMS